MRPVSISAKVEALTNIESDLARWLSQFAPPILSLISRSAVSASGTRSSASARHISATPSAPESEYSCMKASTPPPRAPSARMRVTSRRAKASMAAASAGENRACAMRSATTAFSSAR